MTALHDMFDVKGKSVIVTGGASGLGVDTTREWRGKPLKSLKTDSEMRTAASR